MKSFPKCCLTQVCVHAWVFHFVTSARSHFCRQPRLLSPSFRLSSLCFFSPPTCLSHLRHFFIFYLRRLQRQAKGGWNRRVWNMKQSYVRTIQAAVEKLSRVKHLCTRKHTCTQIHSVLPPKKHLEEDLLLHSWFSFFGQFWNLHCVLQGIQNGDPLI